MGVVIGLCICFLRGVNGKFLVLFRFCWLWLWGIFLMCCRFRFIDCVVSVLVVLFGCVI